VIRQVGQCVENRFFGLINETVIPILPGRGNPSFMNAGEHTPVSKNSAHLFPASEPLDLKKLENDQAGFDRLSLLLKQHAGINLPPTPKNLTLLSTRLRKILRRHGFSTYQQYYQFLRKNPRLVNEFVSYMTTNITQFFRENSHFKVLKDVLPEMLEAKSKAIDFELRIWCAAASTGEEPYSIAMTLIEGISDIVKWDIKFLATDIDSAVLDQAMNGVYREKQIETIPPIILSKYFSIFGNGRYQVKPNLKSMVQFAEFNLNTNEYPFQKPFDIIFCRNVLTYFDQETAHTVLTKLVSQLRPGGVLFLGHSESGNIKHQSLERFAMAAYKKTS